jgi:ribosome-associated translation inhibitor RaiA
MLRTLGSAVALTSAWALWWFLRWRTALRAQRAGEDASRRDRRRATISEAMVPLTTPCRSWKPKPMTIRVNDSVGGSEQTRAYAEYRVFASLAPYSRLVREVEVAVSANAGDAPAVLCDVRVQLDSGPRVNVHARGGHAYEAINRAADRVTQQLSKRVGAALALPGAS